MSGPLSVSLMTSPGESRPVGRLAMKDRRIFFEWDKAFLAAPLPLSPLRLPTRSGVIEGPRDPFDGLHGLFADSLPDAWGRLLIDRARRRTGLPPAGPLDLLSAVGDTGAGALVYAPADPDTTTPEPANLDRLAENATEALTGEIDTEALDRLRRLAGSSGGARPKALLWLDTQDRLFGHPMPGRTAWIIKFRAGSDPEEIGVIEHAYAQLAREAGLTMTDTRLFPSRTGPGWFGTRRFDRHDDGTRPHMASLAGLLEADYRLPSVGYDALVKLARVLTKREADAEAAFRLMVFNVLAHNRDDHAKNVAFLMDDAGDWRLAPAFDLTFSDGPGGEHSMDIMGEGRSPSRADMLRLAKATAIRPRIADSIIEEVATALTDASAVLRNAGVRSGLAAEIAARIEENRARAF